MDTGTVRKGNVKNVLVIGSGPVVIGQAAEFDYSGSQACLSLKEEGITVVLLNSNPATIQTDYAIADRIYIEPISIESVTKIIEVERIDAILASVGGQTALNLAKSLHDTGILQKYNVRILGTDVRSIELAEDRDKFHRLMEEIGEPIAKAYSLSSADYIQTIENMPEGAYIIRTSFSLGGTGGNIVRSKKDLLNLSREFFSINPKLRLNIEQSLLMLRELEYEMMRDSHGNCISICNMENIDPMGVHTGESIVVTPSMTLTDKEYHMLRSAAIRIVGAIGIIGACNIQFALDKETGRYYVVEVNPRTSRSSALASKSTGYPIARISTKLSLGYLLHDVINPITGKTYAAAEPSLDYVTVKIPRWPFDKFQIPGEIGVQMKSIGEVMGIGRTFEEALMKAIASLETRESNSLRLNLSDADLRDSLRTPNYRRLFAVFEALFRNYDIGEICNLTGYPRFFVERMNDICFALKLLTPGTVPDHLEELKRIGISDTIISSFVKINSTEVTRERLQRGIIPCYRNIDTCSGEFESVTPYLYSTYGEGSDSAGCDEDKKKIIILGSGPNRISQGLEFDYGAVKAVMRLIDLGYEAIMVNSNPETVSTDFDISDKLYFEPLTLEHISNILKREKGSKIILQFSGQTGQNLSMQLADLFGEDIFLGTKPSDIYRIEERGTFANSLKRLGINQPEYREIYNINDAENILLQMNLPLIVRSSFIIGGRAMDIIYDRDEAVSLISMALNERPGYPVLVSRYIEDATEMDVDFISANGNVSICGISVHIEEAGTHSGDATMVLGRGLIDHKMFNRIYKITTGLSREFMLVGLSNLQIAVKGEDIYVIELNARASRSLPLISKATGVNFVSMAVDLMLSIPVKFKEYYEPANFFVKIPVFPFIKFPELDVFLSPEMKSTGEAMAAGTTMEMAMVKAMEMYHKGRINIGRLLVTVGDDDKETLLIFLRKYSASLKKIYATPGTARFLSENGIQCTMVYKLEDIRKPQIDSAMLNGMIDAIINTPGRRNRHRKDGMKIRKLAMAKGIPLFTNIRLADAAFKSTLDSSPVQYSELSFYYSSEPVDDIKVKRDAT